MLEVMLILIGLPEDAKPDTIFRYSHPLALVLDKRRASSLGQILKGLVELVRSEVSTRETRREAFEEGNVSVITSIRLNGRPSCFVIQLAVIHARKLSFFAIVEQKGSSRHCGQSRALQRVLFWKIMTKRASAG